MNTQTKLELIETYYAGCSAGDVDAMVPTLTDDVVHYFLSPNPGDAPVRGALHLARYWRKVQSRIDGRWVVDHIIGEGDEAVIEWTLYWTDGRGHRLATRGAEWYRFDAGRIAEIRAYYQQPAATTELRDFDYASRRYSRLGHEVGAAASIDDESP